MLQTINTKVTKQDYTKPSAYANWSKDALISELLRLNQVVKNLKEDTVDYIRTAQAIEALIAKHTQEANRELLERLKSEQVPRTVFFKGQMRIKLPCVPLSVINKELAVLQGDSDATQRKRIQKCQ